MIGKRDMLILSKSWGKIYHYIAGSGLAHTWVAIGMGFCCCWWWIFERWRWS